MHVERIADPVEFWRRAAPLLLTDEVRHNLITGLALTLVRRPEVYPDFRLWLVIDADRPVMAALRTLPLLLVLARPVHPQALTALAAALRAEGTALPGAVGARPEVDDFAAAWSPAHSRLRMTQRLYQLTEVVPVIGVPGRARPAAAADSDLLERWWSAFAAEAVGERLEPQQVSRAVRLRLELPAPLLWLWEDGEPVSMVGFGGETPNGMRIAPVYTPPAQRRRGYAGALTAAVSRHLLDSGRRFCCLFTDLANATSNRIYQAVGYRPVCDAAEWRFEA